jgi:hypothetical protein
MSLVIIEVEDTQAFKVHFAPLDDKVRRTPRIRRWTIATIADVLIYNISWVKLHYQPLKKNWRNKITYSPVPGLKTT